MTVGRSPVRPEDAGFAIPLPTADRLAGTERAYSAGLESKTSGEKSEVRVPRIALTPDGYDKMGMILTRLGYRYETVQDSQLSRKEQLSGFNAVFLNCSELCKSNCAAAGKTLREFVNAGGSVYASDYAGLYLMSAFPELFDGDCSGEEGTVQAEVTNPVVGKLLRTRSLRLVIDMSAWFQIARLYAPGAKVYMRSGDRPLVISCTFGEGEILFTSFHNSAQPGIAIDQLVKFLVVRPLVSDERQAAAVIDQADGNLEKFLQLQSGSEGARQQL